MANDLENALGIEPAKTEVVEQEVIPPTPVVPVAGVDLAQDQEEDYVLSRNTFRRLINQGNAAIEGINDLAKLSESPRAYEVLATLMKTVAETTKDLYDLQKKTKELKKIDGSDKPDNITVEKAVFVGSPTELLRQLKEAKNNEEV